jgi:nucleotide-binding universal stress UspA family protein
MSAARGVRRIVAATDFSPQAGLAAKRAALLAAQHAIPMELLHVVSASGLEAIRASVADPPDIAERLVDDAKRLLDGEAARIAHATGTKASARLVVGEVIREIRAAGGEDTLLVMGAHGANPLGDLLLGTTADRVSRDVAGPVLVVRQTPEKGYANVLAGMDLLPGCGSLLADVAALAPGARITAAHAYELPFESTLHRAGARQSEVDRLRGSALAKAVGDIRRLSEEATGDPGRVTALVERGDPARLIVEHGRAIGADLLAVARRSRSALESIVIGSVARRVVAEADRDVLVLRAR